MGVFGGFRRLLGIEGGVLCGHLLRLDADSRAARFSAITSDATIRRYVDEIDWNWCRMIGYFREGVLRGVAEIHYERKFFPGEAELAFSIEKPYQSSGVGTGLMTRALTVLGNRGVGTASVVSLLSNKSMQRLALRNRANVVASSGVVFMTITVPPWTLGSLMAEAADGYVGWVCRNLEAARAAAPCPASPVLSSCPGGAQDTSGR
ncbi:MAG: GNAT family N-acetyltransferase [Rhodospirillaceae bacterium]